MDPFTDVKPEDVKRLKSLQTDMHDIFKDWVRERRAGKLIDDEKKLFEGQFWTAGVAQELGIIDGFGEVRSFAKEQFGESIRFKEFSPEKEACSVLARCGY